MSVVPVLNTPVARNAVHGAEQLDAGRWRAYASDVVAKIHSAS